MADFENEVFDWDSEIEEDSSFIQLEPGTYCFTVNHFDRDRYVPKAGGKIPECNMAVVHLDINDGKGHIVQLSDRLMLCKKMEWKLSSFFRAIGQKQHGQRLKMDWNAVPGSTGICEVTLDPDDKDPSKKYNHIKGYEDKDPGKEEKLMGTAEVDW